MTTAPHFGREPFLSWHKKRFDRHLVQAGKKRDPRAPDAPTVEELMEEYKTPEASRRLARVLLAGGEFGRPMVTSPGTPADRVRLLREAYMKALNDPELLAEAKKGGMDVEPSSGQELQAFATEIVDQPTEVVERVKKLLGN
jgi:tripartite-type tricarboxylate transporter receptor subunit TctC